MIQILIIAAMVAVLVLSYRAFARRVEADRAPRALPRIPTSAPEVVTGGMCPGMPGVRPHVPMTCASCARVGCLEFSCPRCLVSIQAPTSCRHCRSAVMKATEPATASPPGPRGEASGGSMRAARLG